jgi:hypothetical protein
MSTTVDRADHAATVDRYARLQAIAQELQSELWALRTGPDAALQALMTDSYNSPDRERAAAYAADLHREGVALLVGLQHWTSSLDGLLPPQVKDAADRLAVVVTPREE